MRAALLHSKKVIDSQSSLSEDRKELLRGATDTRNVEDKATYVYTKFTNLITLTLPPASYVHSVSYTQSNLTYIPFLPFRTLYAYTQRRRPNES